MGTKCHRCGKGYGAGEKHCPQCGLRNPFYKVPAGPKTAEDAKRDFLMHILARGAAEVLNAMDEQCFEYFAESEQFESDVFEWWLVGLANLDTNDAERWAKQIWEMMYPDRMGMEPMLGSKKASE